MINHQTPASKAKPVWRSLAATTPGHGHLAEGIPCQDSALAAEYPVACVMVCDGRGSAPYSHLGAEAATKALSTLLTTAHELIFQALDAPASKCNLSFRPERTAWNSLVHLIWRSLGQCQTALAATNGGTPEDYEFTLALGLIGKERAGFLQIGDSLLVMQKAGVCGLVFCPQNDPENPSATWFVGPGNPPRHLLSSLRNSMDIDGLVALSDGTAARLIDSRLHFPSSEVANRLDLLRSQQISKKGLHRFLTTPDWQTATLDDRSIAMVVRSPSDAQMPPDKWITPKQHTNPSAYAPSSEHNASEMIPNAPPECLPCETAPRALSARNRIQPVAIIIGLLLFLNALLLLQIHRNLQSVARHLPAPAVVIAPSHWWPDFKRLAAPSNNLEETYRKPLGQEPLDE